MYAKVLTTIVQNDRTRARTRYTFFYAWFFVCINIFMHVFFFEWQIIYRGLNPKYYTDKKNKSPQNTHRKIKNTTISRHHQQRSIKQPTMICCFKRSDATITQLPVRQRSHQQSLKEPESKN